MASSLHALEAESARQTLSLSHYAQLHALLLSAETAIAAVRDHAAIARSPPQDESHHQQYLGEVAEPLPHGGRAVSSPAFQCDVDMSEVFDALRCVGLRMGTVNARLETAAYRINTIARAVEHVFTDLATQSEHIHALFKRETALVQCVEDLSVQLQPLMDRCYQLPLSSSSAKKTEVNGGSSSSSGQHRGAFYHQQRLRLAETARAAIDPKSSIAVLTERRLQCRRRWRQLFSLYAV